jgi:hypothetical protein
MKFKAVKETTGITAGQVYSGEVVIEAQPRANTNPAVFTYTIKIVVFNDKGQWAKYSNAWFEPA